VSAIDADLYYDPYDFEIDSDPYPTWKRLRDEAPLYYNEKYDFFALSRFDDCEKALVDWRTFSSGRGTVLEMLKLDLQMPPGLFIFEDPPAHDLHRSLMSRVFTPRRMGELEPKIRQFCADRLDEALPTGRFDFIADLGAYMPMRTIGMLLGIPEEDQEAIRVRIDEGLRLDSGEMPDPTERYNSEQQSAFGEYIDWRMENPSDDLMTEIIRAEYEDLDGERKTLSRDEILGYIGLLAAAGNETTTRLIGWTGKVLAEHPDQLAEVAQDRALVPAVIEEVLRYESPSPVQSRYVTKDVELHGRTMPAGSALVVINGSGNRDDRHFEDGDRFDIHRKIDHHLSFGYGLHFCMGAALARLEGRIALDEALKRCPDGWVVDDDHAVQARTTTVRGWQSLPVIVK
jgi:cytochrome P450